MSDKYLLVIGMLLCAGLLNAAAVDSVDATLVARNWWLQTDAENSDLQVKSVQLVEQSGQPMYYIINALGGGYVLVSANDACRPIIAYSDNGSFDYPITSQEVADWMGLYEQMTLDVSARDLSNAETLPLWNALRAGLHTESEPTRNVAPLMTITWNQGNPYNALCPVDATGPGGHVYAGCGAAAMASIMRYWSYPVHGTGSVSYSNPPYGTISANFSAATYNWDNMPATCQEGNLDIALLMYHTAVALRTTFGPTLSTFQTLNFPTALSQYFGYEMPNYRNRLSYSDTEWIDMLKNNLDISRPLVYIAAFTSVSHLFIVDGYQNEDYFHINWVWGGSYDGYYYLDNLNPGGVLYSGGHAGIFDIRPEVAIPITPTYLTADFVSHQFNHLQWVDNSNNETGFVIQRKVEATGTWSDLATTGANATSYQDYAISSQTTYYYRVQAVNGVGSSSWSNEVYIIPSAIIYPVEPQITQLSGSQVRLDWDASLNSAAFRVYRSTLPLDTGDPGWTQIAETTSLFHITDVSAPWMFFYVTALSAIEMPATFVQVPGGTFHNGTANVTISTFWLDKYEVKQESYVYVMGSNPSNFIGDLNRPVEKTTWFNAIEYCNRRSMLEGLAPCYSYSTYGTDPGTWPAGWNTVATNHLNVSCNWSAGGYRLPSEMEWMFAARGGNLSHNYTYSGSNDIASVAWYYSNSGSTTHVIGTKNPNELNTYDLTGNVFEWVWDINGAYPTTPQTDPHGTTTGTQRIARGGSFGAGDSSCTVAFRYPRNITQSSNYLGFRVCRKAP